ncbi:cytochrome P450 [Trametes polyzona]|nr:cytochrome P450 [Trametes polyzona]
METLSPNERSLGVTGVLMALYLILMRIKASMAWNRRLRGRTLPPGPEPLPIIGNLLDMPRLKQWHGFRDMCAEYGDVVYMNILGKSILVIGSTRAAGELLEKRSANTSSRPVAHILPLIGNDIAFSGMQYGQLWRDHKRAFWQVFHPGVSPGSTEEHLRYTLSAMNLKILYGLEAEEENNSELLEKIEEGLSCTTEFASGNHPVEMLPILRHLPGWFPGGQFQYALARCKAAVAYSRNVAYSKMRSKAVGDASQLAASVNLRNHLLRFCFQAEGHLQACALSTLLSKIDDAPSPTAETAYQDEIIRNVGVVALEGRLCLSTSDYQIMFL